MKKLIYTLPFIYLLYLLSFVERALTQDLGRHIKLGEIILSTGRIPTTNTFSYTMPGKEFVNHHWFPEVIFFLIGRSEVQNIIYLKFLLVMLCFGAIFYLAIKMGGLFWSVILSFPFLFILSYRFDARPEIFSFLFLSIFLLVIYLYDTKRSWWYLLPLLLIQVLWVNSHIYFFVGILVYGAYVFSEFILGRRDLRLIGFGLLLCLSLFVTPLGFKGVLVPLTIFSDYGYTIVENQSIVFLNSWFFTPQVLVFEVLVSLFVVCALLTFSKKYLYWYLLSTFAIVASFSMIRNLSLFVILVYPFAVLVFGLFEKKYIRAKAARSVIVTFLVITVIIQVFRGVTSPVFGIFYVDAGESAVNFIEDNDLSGPIFNNFDIGSYLLYRLYPEEKVFVDGRPEAYTTEFFEEYKRIQTEPEFFEASAKKYNFEMIVFSRTDITPWAQEFFKHLYSQDEWVRVYEDPYYVILVKRDSDNWKKLTKKSE